MIPPISLTIRPIAGDRFRAAIVDLSESESLCADPSSRYSWGCNELRLERRSFDKAAQAAASLVAKNVEGLVYQAIIAARGDAEGIVVSTEDK